MGLREITGEEKYKMIGFFIGLLKIDGLLSILGVCLRCV
jgi:hypothetical protein